jgi:hypothetical protein
VEKPFNAKEARVLEALREQGALRPLEMPNHVGLKTLRKMAEKGLIEQIPAGVGPFSKQARWRLKS